MITQAHLDAIKAQLTDRSLVRDVTQLPRGHVRVATSFLLPEGSYVDLFVVDQGLLPPSRLSDLGGTMSWLYDLQVKPWQSKTRQALLHDALRVYGVTQEGGQLIRSLANLDQDLLDGVVLLGQACVRVADLVFTRRAQLQTVFVDAIEEVIADCELDFDEAVDLPLDDAGHVIRVDFLTRGRTHSSAVLGLSSANTSQAHTQANEIFRKWYDLRKTARPESRVTIFDDRTDAIRDDDLERLKDVSDVLAFSDRRAIRDLLAA